MPLETAITKQIVTLAKSRGWWTFKICGGPMQTAGIPDLLVVKNGLAVFFEVKRPGGKPRPLQAQRIKEIREIGGAVAEVVTSRAEAERILNGIDHVSAELAPRPSKEDAGKVAVGDRRRKTEVGAGQMIAINKIPADEVYAELAMNNPEALVARGYAEAYLGFTVGTGPAVAVYDYDKCVDILCESKKIDEEEAVEFLNFHVVFSHFGKNSPLFVQLTTVRK